jgi:3-isopropylmalate/(R)-2-methylmalate dehydratase small subunit
MQPLTKIHGRAAPLPAAHIDTDVIMPKQFLKGIDRAGLGAKVFFDLRYDATGAPRPDFILNRDAWAECCFLVVGQNFGCGSSREHAVWGLLQAGVKALIGTSFAGIFNDNCQRNGLLTVTLPADQIAMLLAYAADPARNTLTLDLESQQITVAHDEAVIAFDIDARRKRALLLGLDAIGATLQDAPAIRQFEMTRRAACPWL